MTAYLTTATLLSLGLGFAIMLSRDWIAGSLWQHPDAGAMVVLVGLAVPLIGAQWATWNIHRISDRAGAYAVLSTIDLVLKAATMVAAALVTGSVIVIVGAYVVSTAIGTSLGLWSVRWTFVRPVLGVAGPLVKGGFPFTVIAVASIAALYAVRAIVAQAGLPEVGDMAVSLRLAGLLALPLAAFQLAWGPPSMASASSSETQARIGRAILATTVIGGVAAVALSMVGPEIILVMAGPAFGGAAQSLPGLAIATVLGTVFFMLSVSAAVHLRGQGPVIAASLLGAAIQVATTSLLTMTDAQVAISVGALVGPSAPVLLVLAATSGVAADDRIRIGAAAIMLVTAGAALLFLIPVMAPLLRWAVALAAGAALGGAALSVMRRNLARDS